MAPVAGIILDSITGDDIMFEREPLSNLAKDGQLMAYRHYDFWQCMDTVRDRKRLEELWSADAPWKAWTGLVDYLLASYDAPAAD